MEEISAKAVSIYIDLLGNKLWADWAVKEIEKSATLTNYQRQLVLLGAAQAAKIIGDEARKLSNRE